MYSIGYSLGVVWSNFPVLGIHDPLFPMKSWSFQGFVGHGLLEWKFVKANSKQSKRNSESVVRTVENIADGCILYFPLVKRMRSQYGLWLRMSHNRVDWLSTAYPSWLLNVAMPKHVLLYVLCSVYSVYRLLCTAMYPPSIGILLSPNVVIPSNQHIAPDQCWAQDRSPRAWKTDTRNLQAPKGPSTYVCSDTRHQRLRSA